MIGLPSAAAKFHGRALTGEVYVRLEVEADEVAHLRQQRPEERLAGVRFLQVVLLVHLQSRAHARMRIVLQAAIFWTTTPAGH